jgi:hypothetical protein
MTTHDKNVWSNNYLFIYGNDFLVKERDTRKNMRKRVITDSIVFLQDILYCLDDLSVKTKTTNQIYRKEQ